MWEKVESTIEPIEIDSTSSITIAYVRRNITFVDATEEKDAHYEYEEMRIPKEYFSAYMAQTATNDYLMMMVED